MNFVKRSFIILSLLVSGLELQAQSLTTPDLNKSMIPPSPEAASLGKYGIVPVTLYEGMPNTSIPVYEIKSSRLSLPISLGYNYNGFTPGVEASWAGLGWSVQASGVITRVVKGQVDEGQNVEKHWKDYANVLDLAMDQSFLTNVAAGTADPEPDIYIFNFNGHSGKFLMVGDRAFTFPHQDLAITRVGTGFRIVAEDGVIYNFYTTESTTSNSSGLYISAWHLTSIISADHTDQIDFQYADWLHLLYNNNYSETYHQQVGNLPNGSGCLGINSACDELTFTSFSGGHVSAKRLTRIISKHTIVDFIPESTQRQDLNSTSAFALKEINVYSLPDTVLLRKMGLVHEYFNYNAQLKLKSVNLTGYYGGNTSANPNISLEGYYTFEYANESSGGFPKNTKGIDKWGYYNEKNNYMLFDANFLGYPPKYPPGDRSVDVTKSINGTLTKITYPTGGYTTFDYEANQLRIPNQSSYEETHHTSTNVNYDGTHNPTYAYGNFRLNEPQTVDITVFRTIPLGPNGEPGWVHNYDSILRIYHFTPGNDDDPPVPAILIPKYASPLIGPADTIRHFTCFLDTGLYLYKVSCRSEAINSGATIDYKKLITPPQGVTEPGPGVRIKEIRSYDSVHLNTPALTKTYSYAPAINLSLSPFYDVATIQHEQACVGNYDENIYTTNYSSPIATLISNQFYYPVVTEVNHDTAGAGKTVYEYFGDGSSALGVNLWKQSDYAFNPANNENILLKQKTNTYTGSSGINFWGFTNQLVHVNDASGNCWLPPLQSTDILDPILRNKIYHAKGYALTSDYLQLTATDETSYEQDGTNPMKVHIDYYYDNINYTQPSRTVVKNSKGETITTLIKYSYDCGTSGCGPGSDEYAFKIKRDEASLAYQNCMEARYNECHPYWNGSIQNPYNGALMAHLANYHCPENYPGQFATALGNMYTVPCPTQNWYSDAGIASMQANHIINTPVEQIVSINRGGNDYLFSANRTEFTVTASYASAPKTLWQTKFNSTSVLKTIFLANTSNYYQSRVNFKYDVNNNLVEQFKTDDIKMAYLWDYKNQQVIAQCANADKDNIAYTSFEADGKGRLNFSGTIITPSSSPPTGKRAYQLTSENTITTNVDASKIYTVSLWATSNSVTVNNNVPLRIGRTIAGWTCYEYEVNNVSTVIISGNTAIDEVRLYPKGALMTTYTYDVLIGMTSQCDPNDHISYYEYDALGRLLLTRNEDRNIIKQYQYNYDRWPVANMPEWVGTGVTRCKPCPANSNYLSNILQEQQHDVNPLSPSIGQTRWFDLGPSQICDANAAWENTGTPSCQTDANSHNTGNLIQVQTDMNPCSSTYGQTRQNISYDPTTCPPYGSVCDDCTGESKKCIMFVCEEGTKVYTSSFFNSKTGMWVCTYHYEWSDLSHSVNYTETSTEICYDGGSIGLEF